ncbi:hypothetical protein ACFQ1M_02355 [Sungkyunkwania multivorans]|uniref:Uncharacterized protein n=1 Tax=Sungkyunkwania multivorans TaxID=1173618 RepID=A0ABW3CVF2_9FLAO
MKKGILFTTVSLCWVTMAIGQQGKLDKSKNSLSTKTRATTSRTVSNSNGSSSDDNSNSFAEDIALFFVQIAGYTAYGIVGESPWEVDRPMHTADFSPYTYYKNGQGEYSLTDGDTIQTVRFDLNYNFLRESSKFNGHQLRFETRFARRFGVALSYLNFVEDSPNLDEDNLSIVSAMANYYRIRTEKMSLWWGLGATHVGSGVDATGFSYQIGARVFVLDPISLESSFKGSFINDETLNQFRVLGKYHYSNYWLSAGYEHFKLGAPTASMFSVGVGVSF